MIKEITTHIANNTIFTIGTDLFAFSIDPDATIDECLIVRVPSPGLSNGILSDLRQVPLAMYARALTRFTAWDNINIVFELLNGKHQISLPVVDGGSTYVCNLECRTPAYTGLDETERRYEFSMPFDVNVTNIL